MTNEAQVEAGVERADAWFAERPWWLESMVRAVLEAAEAAPKLDPFPFTYSYVGYQLNSGRGRQGMSYVSPQDVADGVRFEPHPNRSQKLEHYVGTANAAEYYRALERTR